MDKFIKRATDKIQPSKGRFEEYFLSENPFPSNPIINKDSQEKKFNGSIYEPSIRTEELTKIKDGFIKVPQSDLSHLRLGFIIDSSYVGRGNGKSAFLVNLLKEIENEYCLDISDGLNKCFGIYFSPEGSGAIKTFEKFTDALFEKILNANLINISLGMLRFEALKAMDDLKNINIEDEIQSEDDLIVKLNDDSFYRGKIIKTDLTRKMLEKPELSSLPKEFPLYRNFHYATEDIVNQSDFKTYYSTLRKEKDKYNFIYTDLINLFLAAGFNGAYIMVDDFERIPDFQSAIQKKDFAVQLRSILYDGPYLNSNIGFYNFIMALHAGVPRLMQEAWSLAGLEQRIPMTSTGAHKHIIMFEKITELHAISLLKKYLSEYRILPNNIGNNELHPFTEEAIKKIGVNSELNASHILQMANNIIEYAAEKKIAIIDEGVVGNFTQERTPDLETAKDISTTESISLIDKAKS